MPRNRKKYALLVLGTVGLGLLSRTSIVPEFIFPYIGDAFYALMMYFIMAFVFVNKKPTQIFLLAVGLSFFIEFSQLYHAPWLDAIRNTRLGGLVLGFGFLCSDLVAYTVGGLVGLVLETFLLLGKSKNAEIEN